MFIVRNFGHQLGALAAVLSEQWNIVGLLEYCMHMIEVGSLPSCHFCRRSWGPLNWPSIVGMCPGEPLLWYLQRKHLLIKLSVERCSRTCAHISELKETTTFHCHSSLMLLPDPSSDQASCCCYWWSEWMKWALICGVYDKSQWSSTSIQPPSRDSIRIRLSSEIWTWKLNVWDTWFYSLPAHSHLEKRVFVIAGCGLMWKLQLTRSAVRTMLLKNAIDIVSRPTFCDHIYLARPNLVLKTCPSHSLSSQWKSRF